MRIDFALERTRAAAPVVALVAALCASASARVWAQDNRGLHPLSFTRMTVSDESTLVGVQPWVWAVANGTPGDPARLVAKRAGGSDINAWAYAFQSGLGTAPEAVSFAEGANARQRIFFGTAGVIKMLDFDNNAFNGVTTLPNAPGYTVAIGDVAAVHWVSGPARQMAVAAYAAFGATTGYLCFWEKAVPAANWSTACTTSPVMPAAGGVLPDIVGIVQADTPQFFFRNAANRLGRATRAGVASYNITEHGADAILPSLFVTDSQSAGSIDVGVVRTSDFRVRVGRRTSPVSNTSWVTLPALPGGAIPGGSNVALTGAKFQFTTDTTRTHVSVVSENFRMYTIRTSNDAGSSWQAAWTGPLVPGNPNTTGPEQVPFNVGPTLTAPTGTGSRVFFVGGGAVGEDWATTLQEHMAGTTRPFRDHIRMPSLFEGLITNTTGATESSAGAGPVLGIATAIQRNSPSPWRILISSSDDNGSSFNDPEIVTPFIDSPLPYSASDPVAAHGALGGHLLHLVDVEMSRNNADPNCAQNVPANYRIVYRRGITAEDIATGLSFDPITAMVGATDYDHPGLGITVNSADLPAAHVLAWENPTDPVNQVMKYWMLLQNDVQSGPHAISTAELPPNPAGVVVGNNQSTVYGWTFPLGGGFPTICRMNGSATSGLECGKPNVTPIPTPKNIHFGTGEITKADSLCPPLTSGALSKFRKCFDNEQGVAVAADPTQNNRVHLVYQAPDNAVPTKLAIWYTRNTDNNLDVWTAPLKIAASTNNLDLINPNITIDYQGTIVVTYSRIVNATFANGTNGAADVVVTWSSIDTPTTWKPTTPQVVSSWNANNLPFHCSRRKWFYGEYRYGDVVAGRAQHLLPFSNGGAGSVLAQHAMWFSRQYGLNP